MDWKNWEWSLRKRSHFLRFQMEGWDSPNVAVIERLWRLESLRASTIGMLCFQIPSLKQEVQYKSKEALPSTER